MTNNKKPRWRYRLDKELIFCSEFNDLDEKGWRNLLKIRHITSSNYDTILSLDWPHFCFNATIGCGGPDGWCYTFQGNQAGKLHNRHAAMVDVLARKYPVLFGDIVAEEVRVAVEAGLIKYPNLRYGGSGELVEDYLPALKEITDRGLILWGFTRNLQLGIALREMGISVIISCDRTTPSKIIKQALANGLPLGYSSTSVEDHPPDGTFVTFPIHRVGRVQEVVESQTVCPKVLSDFLYDTRPKGSCQLTCRRCHTPSIPL